MKRSLQLLLLSLSLTVPALGAMEGAGIAVPAFFNFNTMLLLWVSAGMGLLSLSSYAAKQAPLASKVGKTVDAGAVPPVKQNVAVTGTLSGKLYYGAA